MAKRILTILLCAALVFSLAACGEQKKSPESENTSWADFVQVMTAFKERGDQTSEMGLPVESEFFYSYAGASVSAFRYAVEYVLWLKGEGSTLAEFTADSPYCGWETIAEINYSSPYTSYFEGMLYDFQGMNEEAAKAVAMASIMPMFPEEGLDFSYIRTMEIKELYEIRDSLLNLEKQIYSAYEPEITGREWDRYLFDSEYLNANALIAMKNDNNEEALFYAKQSLKADPYDAVSWRAAASCAAAAGRYELLGGYIDEGLILFPEDEALSALKQVLINVLEGTEVK